MAQASPAPLTDLRAGMTDILPLAIGVAVYGLAFGLLAAQANMAELQVGVMGASVFAGASQIVAVERLVAGGGALAAFSAAVVLNFRLLLITASIRDIFAGRPLWQRVLGAHLANDESWATFFARRNAGTAVGYWYLVGSGLTLAVVWLTSTIAGVSFAAGIPEPRALGMDFAFTAAFIALARGLWRGRSDLLPWVVAIAVVVGLGLIPGLEKSWSLLIGALAGAATAAVTGND